MSVQRCTESCRAKRPRYPMRSKEPDQEVLARPLRAARAGDCERVDLLPQSWLSSAGCWEKVRIAQLGSTNFPFVVKGPLAAESEPQRVKKRI